MATTNNMIYTHDEAVGIIERFEDVLEHHGIHIPSIEDYECELDDVYNELIDSIESILIELATKSKSAEIIVGVHSGTL